MVLLMRVANLTASVNIKRLDPRWCCVLCAQSSVHFSSILDIFVTMLSGILSRRSGDLIKKAFTAAPRAGWRWTVTCISHGTSTMNFGGLKTGTGHKWATVINCHTLSIPFKDLIVEISDVFNDDNRFAGLRSRSYFSFETLRVANTWIHGATRQVTAIV